MNSNEPAFKLHDSLGHWVIRLSRAMQHNLSQQLAAYELNSRLLAVLMSVEDVEARTPSGIADYLLVDRAIVARALRDLRSRNLVDYCRNENDGRSRTLRLTDDGIAILELGRETMRICDQFYKERLPPDLTAAIRQLFHQSSETGHRRSNRDRQG